MDYRPALERRLWRGNGSQGARVEPSLGLTAPSLCCVSGGEEEQNNCCCEQIDHNLFHIQSTPPIDAMFALACPNLLRRSK